MTGCRFVLPILLCGALLSACAGVAPMPDAGVTFIVVRHAEKSNDDPRDPSLSETGHARAQRLADKLSASELVAAYATGYQRTQQTVQPAAGAQGIAVETYDAGLPATELAARLKAAHSHGIVLVAGHSNTVPDIVSALCACIAEPMPDDEYDRISIVRITRNGSAMLEVLHDATEIDSP